MNGIIKVLRVAALSLILIPCIAISGKPDVDECPCLLYYHLALLGVHCLQDDPQLVARGGWPSPSDAPNPVSEFILDAIKAGGELEIDLHVGVKEVENEIFCSVTGTEEVEPGVFEDFEHYETNPQTEETLTLDEARSCVFATRVYYDAIVEEDWFCE